MARTLVKKCPDCQQDKKLTRQFWHIDRASGDGFNQICKPCRNARSRANYKKNSRKKKQARQVSCYKCIFLDECKARIWDVNFDLHCSPESAGHQAYVNQYRIGKK